MHINHKIISYDKEKYDFQRLIVDLFEEENLEKIHNRHQKTNEIKPVAQDTHTDLHKKFYNKLDYGWNDLKTLYRKFIKEFILSELKMKKVYYQTYPNLRIAFPENVAVSDWHKDTDDNNHHPFGEINFFLPLTKSHGNNSLWIESEPNKKDFKPVNLNYGDIFMFNGGECTHGNNINDTNLTRISFDFRLMPPDKYDPKHPHKTATRGHEFKLGQYYRNTDENE